MRLAEWGMALSAVLFIGWVALLDAARRRSTRDVRRSRRVLLVGAALAAVLTAGQAGVVEAVEDSAGVAREDRPLLDWLVAHRSASVTAVLDMLSTVGGATGMTVVAVVAAAVLWRRRNRTEAGVALVTVVGAGFLVTVFKHLYTRARPPLELALATEATFSLPSGHALDSIAVLGILAAVVLRLARRPAVRYLTVGLAAVAVVMIGVSRIYLGAHWLTDVLTAWLLGGAWLAVCVTALALVGGASTQPVGPQTKSVRGGAVRRRRDGGDLLDTGPPPGR